MDILHDAGQLPAINPATAAAIAQFLRLLDDFRSRLEHDAPLEVASRLIQQVGYQDEIARRYDDALEQQSRAGPRSKK